MIGNQCKPKVIPGIEIMVFYTALLITEEVSLLSHSANENANKELGISPVHVLYHPFTIHGNNKFLLLLSSPSLHPGPLHQMYTMAPSQAPFSTSCSTSSEDKTQLQVLIIGAGLCGLGLAISVTLAGHRATVYESYPSLHEVGAGLQITPNGVRILRQWGIANELKSRAAAPETFSMIRYDGTKVLAQRNKYGEELRRRYGESIWCLHRVELQIALARRAEELGVRINFECRVRDVDLADPSLLLENGRVETGDLIIAADGLWSSTRSLFLGRSKQPNPTGDLAYRIVLTAEQVIDDLELHEMITHPGIRIWMGPQTHAVAYSLKGGQMLNVVLLVKDDLPPNVAKAEGDLGEMGKLFEGWDPLLTRLLKRVNKVDKWKLNWLQMEEGWTSKQGTFTMAGDACHPILPYMAQGANS